MLYFHRVFDDVLWLHFYSHDGGDDLFMLKILLRDRYASLSFGFYLALLCEFQIFASRKAFLYFHELIKIKIVDKYKNKNSGYY